MSAPIDSSAQSVKDRRLSQMRELKAKVTELSQNLDMTNHADGTAKWIAEWKLRRLKRDETLLEHDIQPPKEMGPVLQVRADGVGSRCFTLQLSECPLHDSHDEERFIRLNTPVERWYTMDEPMDVHDPPTHPQRPSIVNCSMAMTILTVNDDQTLKARELLDLLAIESSASGDASLPFTEDEVPESMKDTQCVGCKEMMQDGIGEDGSIELFAISVPGTDIHHVIHPECVQDLRTATGKLDLPDPEPATSSHWTAVTP